MGPYHWLIGSLMEPGDDFGQQLRKATGALMFFPGSLVTFYFIVEKAQRLDGTQVSITNLIGNIIITCVFWLSYAFLRKVRHMGDLQVSLAMWTVQIVHTSYFLNMCEFDNKGMHITIAVTAISLQVSRLPLFLAMNFITILLHDWNHTHITTPDQLLVIPGANLNSDLTERFIQAAMSTCLIFAVFYGFVRHIQESERRGVAQKAANDMTMKVLQRQRCYDTKEVGNILSQCSEQSIVDSELIKLFQEMNDNLESYRAFLPNYLFLGKGGQQGEDDAMSILSDAPVGVFQVELDEDLFLDSSDGESEKSHHSSNSSNGKGSQESTEKLESAEKVNILMKQPQQHPQQQVQEAPGPAASSYCGNIVQAWVEIQNNEWFSTKLVNKPFSSRSLRYQRNTMSVFTESLFDLAQTTKASVHSLVGDTVQLSWNATHRVAQPELKASTFLLRLKQALSIALPDVKLAGAACAGQAEVHNITSFGTHQRAMYVDAPWTPALEACFTLAKRHKTLVVDANVECGSHYIVAAQGVDCIRYVPKVAIVPGTGEPGVGTLQSGAHGMPNLMPKGFPPATPDAFDTLLGVQGPQQEESAQTFLERKPVQHTIAYELVRRKQQEISGDQEWMYQLPEGEGGSDDASRREIEPLVTKALLLVADGRAGEAALLLVEKKVINLNRKTDEGTQRSEQGQRSAAYAAEVMYSDDDGEDPDYTPVTTIRLDPIAKAVALANPGKEAEEKAKPLPVNNALLERLAKFCHGKT